MAEDLTKRFKTLSESLINEFESPKAKGLIITWTNPLIDPLSMIRKASERVVCLNAGLLVDPKLLLGTFSVDEEPGVFKWKNGFLLEAVSTGMILVLEDIHLANSDLLILLHQLIGDRTFYDTYRSENLSVHPEFRVIGTSGGHLIQHNNSLLNYQIESSLWTIKNIDMEFEPEEFFTLKYSLEYTRLLLDICTKSYRDLRLAVRLFSRCAHLKSIETIAARNAIYQHICSLYSDCVPEFYSYVKGKLAIEPLDLNFEFDENVIKLGFLTCAKLGFSLELPYGITIHRSTRETFSSIISSFANNEPVLLVGETGTGKTTIVQYFARLMGQQNFFVINLSQQSEASDLLGGYKPLSRTFALKSLSVGFREFFSENFSVEKNSNLFSSLDEALSRGSIQRIVDIIYHVLQKIPSSATGRDNFEKKFDAFKKQIANIESGVIFHYEEGILLKAIRHGYWILLDEINLASSDLFSVIYGLLSETHQDNVNIITDSGTKLSLKKHPNFRLFACMNPATDYGKKDLPDFLKKQFSIIAVPEPDSNREEFLSLISCLLGPDYVHLYPESPSIVSEAYYTLKSLANQGLIVGEDNKKPLINLRSLSRAVGYATSMGSWFPPKWSLYEGLLLAFSTALDNSSCEKCLDIVKTGIGKIENIQRIINGDRRNHDNKDVFDIWFGFPLKRGCEANVTAAEDGYVFTATVNRNIANLARAISARKYPILLEGPTSTGKTSSIYFLAKKTFNRVVRINNHEYTELSEYIGSYSINPKDGSLYFKDGFLVKALRNGYWLLLDELNLAPTEVLEALNRLLDDNRELYVPETSETIRPHPNFMLFATQNPAGSLYGGRKHLSRAFRSRFLEINVPPILPIELETILSSKCRIAPSQAKKLANVYQMLQERRTIAGNVFAGKNALMTLRDLFRWASRKYNLTEDLAMNGVDLIGERCRSESERQVIIDIIRRVFKSELVSSVDPVKIDALPVVHGFVWTFTMRRLFNLCLKCIENKEPILLVGETGCGKTSLCYLLSRFLNRPLVTLNCHQNTETSDFIGTFRPSRDKTSGKLFEFYDGPLITSMTQGNIFLMDEISLSEDSVLESLNSVLEPERSITVTEGNDELKLIEAVDNFIFVATMNPGGDFGKKELSPALRSRFTEIWVEEALRKEDLLLLINKTITCDESFSNTVADIFIWVKAKSFDLRFAVSLRDLGNLLTFLNSTEITREYLWEGLEMIFFDRTGLGQLGEECRLYFKLSKSAATCGFTQFPGSFGIDPFFYSCSTVDDPPRLDTCFNAPTTLNSARKILRALQIRKPILLEGPPGVGKSTIISTLSRAAGRYLYRYNLSEQTDLTDLFGSDLPVPNGLPGQFAWVDGPFLSAIQNGDWILLDEINLASQSILEGLNAILDHRGEAYIPELDRSFRVHPDTRIFAAQNPVFQGGNRKSLPKSFLNRFTWVWFEELTFKDYEVILVEKFPSLDKGLVHKSIRCVQLIAPHLRSMAGYPWELNLRDLFRLFSFDSKDPLPPFRSLLVSRFRSSSDRSLVANIIEEVFSTPFLKCTDFGYSDNCLFIGSAFVNNPVLIDRSFTPLSFQLRPLEALINSINGGYLTILTGASGSGKSSMIKFLSKCYHVKCNEISLTPETDTMELLGTYVQFDYRQSLTELLKKAGAYVDEIKDVTELGKQIITSDHLLYSQFVEIESKATSSSGRFEWQDGPLIKAMIKGDWIIFSHANLASSAVLDRLNSLFEPNGVIHLPEQGSQSDGSVRTLKPSPNFRAFLVYDPKFGEISCAMRNRGIEIHVDITECDLFDQYKLAKCPSLLREKVKSIREVTTTPTQNNIPLDNKVLCWWINQEICDPSFATDFTLSFDKSNMIVGFFNSINWGTDTLSKNLIFNELLGFFGKSSLTELALSYKNVTDLDLVAPEYYDLWVSKYKPLYNTALEHPITDNNPFNRIYNYLDALSRSSYVFSNEQSDFVINSKAFTDFNSNELILMTHGFGMKHLLGELVSKLEKCTVGELFLFESGLKKFSLCSPQITNFKKPTIDGDLFEVSGDPNDIWNNRLLAKKCIRDLFEDELFTRMRYLFFKLGSANFDFDFALERLDKLRQYVSDLESQLIMRPTGDLSRILFSFNGIKKFLTERRLEDVLMMRRELFNNNAAGCFDLMLLYCSRLDPLLWKLLFESRIISPQYQFGFLEFLNEPKAYLTSLLDKLPEQKIESRESIFFYKNQPQSEEQEDEKFIEDHLTHKSLVNNNVQHCCWGILQIMHKDGRYIFDQTCLSVLKSLTDEDSLIPDREMPNYIGLINFPKYQSFYSSVDVKLLIEKLPVIQKLKDKTDMLLEEFHYNESLQDVSRLCAEFCTLSIDRSSMISLVLFLVRILNRADEWQKLADKAHLLPLDSLIEWIIEWRRLEVIQWEPLFLNIRRDFESEAIEVGMHLVKILINADITPELIFTVDSFLLACPAGQLLQRLDIIQSSSQFTKARNLLDLLISYYKVNIVPKIEEYLSSTREPLEAELKLFLQTMHWNDHNLYSMQASTNKSHKTLARILRNYKDALSRSVSSILTERKGSIHTEIDQPKPVVLTLAPNTLASNIFENVSQIVRDFDAIARPLNDLISSIKFNVDELISKPVQSKQSALTLLFKTSKFIGIKLFKSPPQDVSLSWLLYRAGSRITDPLLVGTFSRLLGKWNEFEESSNDPHPDIGPREIEIARNILYQLLEFVLSLNFTDFELIRLFEFFKSDHLCFIKDDFKGNFASLFQDTFIQSLKDSSYIPKLGELRDLYKSALELDSGMIISKPLQGCPSVIRQSCTKSLDSCTDSLLILLQRLSSLKYALDQVNEFGLGHGHLIQLSGLLGSSFSCISSALVLVKENLPEALGGSAAIKQLMNIFEVIYGQLVKSSLTITHLTSILFNLFTQLVRQGYCRPTDAEVDQQNSTLDEGKLEGGTGMAEGTGEKNVSQEMEFEDQITDLQGSQPQTKEDDVNGGEDDEGGCEMEQDFEGVLKDLMEEENEVEDDDQEEFGEEKFEKGDNTDGNGKEDEVDPSWWEDEEKENSQATLDDPNKGERQTTCDNTDSKEDQSKDGSDPDCVNDDFKGELELKSEEEDSPNDDENEDPIDQMDIDEDEEKLNSESETIENESIGDGEVDAQNEELHSENEELEKCNLPPMYSKQDPEDILPEQLFDESNDQEGTGTAAAIGSDQNEFGNKRSLGGDGVKSILGQSETKRPKKSDSQPIGAKPKEEPSLRSLFDVLDEELSNGLSSLNQNVANQQYSRAEEGQVIMGRNILADSNPQDKLQEHQSTCDYSGEEVVEEMKQLQPNDPEEIEFVQSILGPEYQKVGVPPKNVKEETVQKPLPTWTQLQRETDLLASNLCEQLRLIMVPTVAARLKGDYKSGKRLNIRKILPFIASGYRRNKIWLRRTKLSSRNYRIVLAIDNSRSMQNNAAGEMALKAAAVINGALKKLETGNQFSILSFGSQATVINLEDNPDVITSSFTFDEDQTNILQVLEKAGSLFSDDVGKAPQLSIFISDGVCADHYLLRQALNIQQSRNIISLFVIIDKNLGKQSITELTQVDKDPLTGKLVMKKYLQDFPFSFYVIVQDIRNIPEYVSEALRQWFRTMQSE